MSQKIYDITPPVSDATKVFPGDTPPSREVLLDMKRGANLTLSTLRTTVHVGAHVDAPSHYGADAPSIELVALERCIGPCQVVRVDVERGALIAVEALRAPLTSERVLFATGTFPDPTRFNGDFAAFSPGMIDHLHDAGVRLVGIDTPSVDPATSKNLPSHRRCLVHDILILEGIVLDGVPEGEYELIAAPLRFVGFDASPVRAVLRSPP